MNQDRSSSDLAVNTAADDSLVVPKNPLPWLIRNLQLKQLELSERGQENGEPQVGARTETL